MNCAATKKHVGQTEHNIRTEKERCRATSSRVPCKKLPLLVANALVTEETKWLNAFPMKGGVSKMLSPRATLAGFDVDFNRDC